MKKHKIMIILLLLVSCLFLSSCIDVDLRSFKYKLDFIVDGEVYRTVGTDGSSISMPQDPIKENYKFQGWFWDVGHWKKPFTIQSLLDQPIQEENNYKVYSKWDADSFTIVFDSDGGSPVDSVTQKMGTALNLPIPSKQGKDFLKWQWNGEDFVDTVMPGRDVALKAVWAPLQVYTVTYENLQGGTNPNSIVNYTRESEIDLLPPTRPHYVGTWDRDRIEKGSTGNLVIRAVWTPVVYKITYSNLRNGTNPNEISAYTVESDEIVFENPTRDGYSGKWDRVSIPKGSNGDVTVQAIWTALDYIVTMDVKGGDALAQNERDLTFGSSYTLPVPTRTGYAFSGWFLGATCLTNNIGQSLTPWDRPMNAGLEARWNPKEYTVALVADGEQYYDPNQFVCFGKSYHLPTPWALSGYHFLGWYSSLDEDGVAYTNSWGDSLADWNLAEDLTLYAKFAGNTYTIRGVTGVAGDEKEFHITFGSMYHLSVPTRDGYDFNGWFEYYNSGVQYTDENGDSLKEWDIDFTGYMTIFASWSGKPYSVTLDHNDGSAQSDSVQAVFSSPMPEFESPTKANSLFVGYFDSDGVQYYSSQMNSLRNWDKTHDETLYARWMDPDSGDGSAQNPFVLSTAAQLSDFSAMVNNGQNFEGVHFKLGTNINLGDAEWIPIGVNYEKTFAGSFDGGGFGISGFKMTKHTGYTGMFGYLGATATVGNLTVSDFRIDIISDSWTYYAGALAAYNNGRIFNCTVNGTLSAVNTTYNSYYTAYIGGIAGYNAGVIEACEARGSIKAESTYSSNDAPAIVVGGIAGGNVKDAAIKNCGSFAQIQASTKVAYAYAGCLVGLNEGSIVRSSSDGEVRIGIVSASHSGTAGGLVGANAKFGTINDCFSLSDVEVTTSNRSPICGGLVGENVGQIERCFASGNVISYSNGKLGAFAGGLVGVNAGNIGQSFASGNLTAATADVNLSAKIGGLTADNTGTVVGSYRYAGQTFSRRQGQNVYTSSTNADGNACTRDDLNRMEFFRNDLGWSEEVWDLTQLNFEQNLFPTLNA